MPPIDMFLFLEYGFRCSNKGLLKRAVCVLQESFDDIRLFGHRQIIHKMPLL